MSHGNAHNYVQDPSIDPRPLLLDIARGLCYLHNYVRPIFHGDVKGANVLISDRGRALLTDFGLSFLTSSSFSMSTPRGGSLPWLTPENLDSHECAITRPGDIWAFGMTALELFTRENPFSYVRNLGCLFVQILQGPPERPIDEVTCSRMTDDWWSVCSMCWHRDPISRPEMSELVARIEQLEPCRCEIDT
ncbi:hypothetical protein ID866_9456 [Astraeus odoratus]|nr:hypothetical protein ID866_9456 [Astraeus odoratus]